jgi:hypothetical protein
MISSQSGKLFSCSLTREEREGRTGILCRVKMGMHCVVIISNFGKLSRRVAREREREREEMLLRQLIASRQN